MHYYYTAVEATLRGDSVPLRVDSISVDTPKSTRSTPANGSTRLPIMKQRNLPPIPTTTPDPPGRGHPGGRSLPPPSSLTRVPSNGDHSSQVPPPRGTRRTNSSSQPVVQTSTSPVPNVVTGPPIPVRPSGSKPQAPPKPVIRSQKPPVSNRPKPAASKPLTRTPSKSSDRLDNLGLEAKIQAIQDDAPVIIEHIEQMKPGLSHQLENFALMVDAIISDANSATNDSSVQFKRHLAALRSQTGYLRDPSLHHDVIRLVRVIEMIVTKSQQLSSHLH